MSRVSAKQPITSAGVNPLAPQVMTIDAYAAAHRTLKSRATMLMRVRSGELERELEQELVVERRKTDAMERELKNLRQRRTRLRGIVQDVEHEELQLTTAVANLREEVYQLRAVKAELLSEKRSLQRRRSRLREQGVSEELIAATLEAEHRKSTESLVSV